MTPFLAGFSSELTKLATPIPEQDAPTWLHHSKTNFGAPAYGGPQNAGGGILGPDGMARPLRQDHTQGTPIVKSAAKRQETALDAFRTLVELFREGSAATKAGLIRRPATTSVPVASRALGKELMREAIPRYTTMPIEELQETLRPSVDNAAKVLLKKFGGVSCKRCSKPATCLVLWAEGRGGVPSCEAHKEAIAAPFKKKDDFSGFKKTAMWSPKWQDHVRRAKRIALGLEPDSGSLVGRLLTPAQHEHVEKLLSKTANDPIKKRYSMHGLPIAIEWPKGSTRKYYDKKDPKKVNYEKKMEADYGYISGTKDHDDEQLDVYVGPDRKSTKVFVVKQLKDDGSFDEHKVMLGFADLASAKACFLKHMPPKRWGGAESTDVDGFKEKHHAKAREMRKAAYALLRDRIREGGNFLFRRRTPAKKKTAADEFAQLRHHAHQPLPETAPGMTAAARTKRPWNGRPGSADAVGQPPAPKSASEIPEPMVAPAGTAEAAYAG